MVKADFHMIATVTNMGPGTDIYTNLSLLPNRASKRKITNKKMEYNTYMYVQSSLK